MSEQKPYPTKFSDLDWSRLNPCNDCPFLKTTPYHGGVAGSLLKYLDTIEDGNFAHTCHKTDNRPACDGPRDFEGEKPQHCAGALLCLTKTGNGKDLQVPLLQAAEAGLLDLKALTARAKLAKFVFTLPEMVRFYLRELSERARRARQRRHGLKEK